MQNTVRTTRAAILLGGKGTRVAPASVIEKCLFPVPGPDGLEPALARHVRILRDGAVKETVALVRRGSPGRRFRELTKSLGFHFRVMPRTTRSLRAAAVRALELSDSPLILILPDLLPVNSPGLVAKLCRVAGTGSAIAVARVPAEAARGNYGIVRVGTRNGRLIGLESLEKPIAIPDRFIDNGHVHAFAGYYLIASELKKCIMQDRTRGRGEPSMSPAIDTCMRAGGLPLVLVAEVLDLGTPATFVTAVNRLASIEWGQPHVRRAGAEKAES